MDGSQRIAVPADPQARRPAAGPAVRITPGRPSSGPRRYSPARP